MTLGNGYSVDVRDIQIHESEATLRAVQKLNETASQILFVVDAQGVLVGTLTDGDIRRAIIAGRDLALPVGEVCNRNPKSARSSLSRPQVLALMEKHGISRLPVVNRRHEPVGVFFLEDLLPQERILRFRENKVVIMAGGRGSRLDPITRIVPKPLLPVGEKPMLELIMESFGKRGFQEFLLSINYRKDFIKTYLAERGDLPFKITCVEEESFLGTAGSLTLMRDRLERTFFVSNCDILVDVNYVSALEFHQEHRHAFTIVGALKKVSVPYGVIHLREGEFERVEEKPEVPLIVNTGVYLLEPECVDLIPRGEKFDMTDLIEKIRATGGSIGVFPVHRRWIDIGQWGEYKQVLQ